MGFRPAWTAVAARLTSRRAAASQAKKRRGFCEKDAKKRRALEEVRSVFKTDTTSLVVRGVRHGHKPKHRRTPT